MNNKIIVARFSGLILLVSSYALVLSCKNSKTKYSFYKKSLYILFYSNILYVFWGVLESFTRRFF